MPQRWRLPPPWRYLKSGKDAWQNAELVKGASVTWVARVGRACADAHAKVCVRRVQASLQDPALSATARAGLERELASTAADVQFCVEQVQWYALHLTKVARGEADPDLDNRAW